MRQPCRQQYHDVLYTNPFAWRLKTAIVAYEVDTGSTVELACCRWCGQQLARTVWRDESR